MSKNRRFSAPDFDSKIRFNGLGRQISTLLHYGAYQAGLVDGYFEMNSDFTKQDLRNILNERYRNSRERHMQGGNAVPNVGEIIFFDVQKSIVPANMTTVNAKRAQDEAIVLFISTSPA